MWFKLASANFSNNNLGKMSTLSTTWPITKKLSGFTETTSTGTSVDRGAAYYATFKLDSGKVYKSHSVTMNGSAVTSGVSYSGGTLTVSISAVTGPVVITTSTSAENVGTVLTPIETISGKLYNRSKTLSDHGLFSIYRYSVANIGAIDVTCTSGAITTALWEIDDGSTRLAFWGLGTTATHSLLIPEDAVAIAVSGLTADGCTVTTISTTGELILPPIEETFGYFIKTGSLANTSIDNYVTFKFDVSRYNTIGLSSVKLGTIACACWTDAAGNRYEIVNGADSTVITQDFSNSNNYPYLEIGLGIMTTETSMTIIGK